MGKFDCKGILRTMSDYLDGDLGKSVCSDIEEHLTTCRKCRFHVDAVKLTIEIYDEWRGEEMPRDAEIRLRDRLRAETDASEDPPARQTRTRGASKRAAAREAGRTKASGARRKKGASKPGAARKPSRRRRD